MATTVESLSDLLTKDIEKGFEEAGTYRKKELLKITTDAIDFSSVAGGAEASNVKTDVTGVKIGDVVLGIQANGAAADAIHDPGMFVAAKVTDEDEITIQLLNETAGALDPGSQTFTILVLKLQA